ncbi:MAG TPA: hypothetical protein DF613_04445 [Lachnospiraceae bacterium]|nr:hypothetical protein [Lachnospiraceae bacterium]
MPVGLLDLYKISVIRRVFHSWKDRMEHIFLYSWIYAAEKVKFRQIGSKCLNFRQRGMKCPLRIGKEGTKVNTENILQGGTDDGR